MSDELATLPNATIELKQNGKIVRTIGPNNPCFVIAEIGQNHQGSLHLALEMIKEAALAGVDCVKFQLSSLDERFTQAALDKEYTSPNSFGRTYREHRQAISLTREELAKCQQAAINEGILFSASGTDRSSLDFLATHLDVPFLKIGSGDSNNPLLIEYASKKFYQPLIISTGMVAGIEVIDSIYSSVLKHRPSSSQFALLHCVSSYPTSDADVNLCLIPQMKIRYPKSVIGYSGHELGTEISLAAVALGAQVIERHVTLDHDAKGSDHKCSLLPKQLKNLVSSVRRVECAMGCLDLKNRKRMLCEDTCYRKLGKFVVTTRQVSQGDLLTSDNLDIKVTDENRSQELICGEKIHEVLGRVAKKSISKDMPLKLSHLCS